MCDNVSDKCVSPAAGVSGVTTNAVVIPLGHLTAPRYYIDAIPASKKPIYDVFDVRYVQVVKDKTTYFILSQQLDAVVKELGLYA
jgi:hypothetical protein